MINPINPAKAETENQVQVTVIEWLQKVKPHLYNMTFHVPNQRKASPGYMQTLKRMGVRAGVPDLMIAFPMHGYHGLFVELKKASGSYATEKQKDWVAKLNQAGYIAVVCRGTDEAMQAIQAYDAGKLQHLGHGKWQLIQPS
jgi:hypothetical protein